MNLKTGIKMLLVGIAIIGMISSAAATNNCALYVASCKTKCTTTGQCGSGEYSGTQTGCKNGDPSVSKGYHANVDLYLKKIKRYSQTWTGSSYDNYDYTKRIDSDGDCRWQARRTTNNHYVYYKDGPEPNPQPVPFGNNNADLWNPFGCVKKTIQAWHAKC